MTKNFSLDNNWNFDGTYEFGRLSDNDVVTLRNLVQNVGDYAYRQGLKDGEQEHYTRGYLDGRGWRDKQDWHYKPECGWDEDTYHDYGKPILIARIYTSLKTNNAHAEYSVGYFLEDGTFENDDFFICDIEEVDAWKYFDEVTIL